MAQVLLFGELKDVCGSNELVVHANSTDELLNIMMERWPSLSAKTIAIAVNKSIIHQSISISDSDIVAFMPPYSGG